MDLSKQTASNTSTFGLAGKTFFARLIDVQHGDTVTVIAEVFPSMVFQLHVRLSGIDTPEMESKNPIVKALAERARLRSLSLLTNGTAVPPHAGHLTRSEMMSLLEQKVHVVQVRCHEMDAYGRVLADVARDDHYPHVGMILLSEGLARPYSCGTKDLFA